MKNLQPLRREYHGALRREDLDPSPFRQFDQWLAQAVEQGLADPTAMTVATVAPDGQPSQRIVLLKQVDARGFVFYTNYSSRKARELAQNPLTSLHFPWHGMDRQVKICGSASRITTAESRQYFLSRPRESRLAATASPQSATIASRRVLLEQVEAIREKYRHDEIPLPEHWGGYRVRPTEFEFWQGSENRLHDRFRYRRTGQGWQIDRLAP